MRIAIVTETWPPEVNGVALTVQSLARGLVTLGHDVEVVRPRRHDDADAPPEFDEHLLPGAALPRYAGLRVGLPAQGPLARAWSRRRPDALYVATEGPLGHSALRAANALGIAACTGFHTRFDDFAAHYGLGLLTPLVFTWLRRFHNRGRATLVPTESLATFLRAHGFRHVRLLRRAVDTDLFHPRRRDDALRREWGVADGELVILHVGRLAAEKNLDLAVRAFEAIRARQPARLVMVGDGPVRDTLAARHPEIIFTGVRRGEDLARHYASGDLFLFPSLTDTFGNVTLEALASGVPVIAHDYAAAREHLHDPRAGCRVPMDDEQAFIDAALAWAGRLRSGDQPVARRAARAQVEGLSPPEVSAQFALILDGLAQRSAA